MRMDYRKNCRKWKTKCVDLEKKVLRLERQLSEANHKKDLWRNKYHNVKQNVKNTCKFCGQTCSTENKEWQNHFMRVCPIVKNACQRLLNRCLLEESEKNGVNIDNQLPSIVHASVQLVDLNLLPEEEVISKKSNEKIVGESNGFEYDSAYESVPEVSVEIEIPMSFEEFSDTIDTISIGY